MVLRDRQPGGRTLVLPLIAVYGESYTDPPGYPDDDPDDYVGVGRIDFLASSLLLQVDGRVVADSTRTKLDCVSFGPVYLPEPVTYPEPTSYGSNAALWIAGLGILLPPMPPGGPSTPGDPAGKPRGLPARVTAIG